MPGVRLRWYGPQVERTLRGRFARDLERCGDQVRRRARVLCPVDTGKLRSSIEVVTTIPNMRVAIGTDVEYAKYVHDGYTHTSGKKIPPNPFLQEALDEVTASFRFSTG